MRSIGVRTGYRMLSAALRLPALTLVVATAGAQANVFGIDDRRDIFPEDNLSGVGIIVCEGTTRRPTGALVTSPSLPSNRSYEVVVSVAHAFLGSHGRRLPVCEFWPQANAALAVKIAFLETGTLNPYSNWHNDWAVAVLDRRLPDDYSRLTPRVLDEEDAETLRDANASFLLAGHNGERGPLQVSTKCGPVAKHGSHLNRFDPRVFNHDCDMMPGWSGGPLILREKDESYLVAVNSTEINAITHIYGSPYNGRMNPNTAVRVDGRFLRTIHNLIETGGPGPSVECLVASNDNLPALPC
jgi:hypothetical protein